jgi:ABC-type polysaccharide/polyol phosphate transport system ATPase subunit
VQYWDYWKNGAGNDTIKDIIKLLHLPQEKYQPRGRIVVTVNGFNSEMTGRKYLSERTGPFLADKKKLVQKIDEIIDFRL